jgi:hypothetical protein
MPQVGTLVRARPADVINPGWTAVCRRLALDYQLTQGRSWAAGFEQQPDRGNAFPRQCIVSNRQQQLVADIRQPIDDRGGGDEESWAADQPGCEVPVAFDVRVPEVVTFVDENESSSALR